MASEPGVEGLAIAPHLGNPLAGLRGRDPGADPPTLPEDQALVTEQIAARMILRIGRRDALQILAADAVTMATKRSPEPAAATASR
jgi:hypothetical protein